MPVFNKLLLRGNSNSHLQRREDTSPDAGLATLPSMPMPPPQPQPGWLSGRAIAYPPYPQMVVNQHYSIGAPLLAPAPAPAPFPAKSRTSGPGSTDICKLNLGSVANLATDILPMHIPHLFDDGLPSWHASGSRLLNQSAALYDQLSSKFDNAITLIDRGRYTGINEPVTLYPQTATSAGPVAPSPAEPAPKHKDSLGQFFCKADYYANARLPPYLPPMRLYIATYPLLSLAAKYAEHVYERPRGAERYTHIDADWRTGTKAMVIKSVPMDDANIIVFAIRGTATFMDWAVNLNLAPASPVGFLDDPGNLCHAGFLSAARKMVAPVAARLRQLLQEMPARAAYSLLITGHSAGGAVAALLYAHMLSTSTAQAASELNTLSGCFRRIHCITFGSPPVSLLPLRTPPGNRASRKNVFLSFVNEGDPVARADKEYVKSLLELFVTPAPASDGKALDLPADRHARKRNGTTPQIAAMKSPFRSLIGSSSPRQRSHKHERSSPSIKPMWPVPPATLSSAGRIVVLRSAQPQDDCAGRRTTVEKLLDDGVVAQMTDDEQLRTVVWGNPTFHAMRLYAGRIETLAIHAVTRG